MVIKNIASSDVQRITSGQVIVDIVSIVKELVENSLDSGCTRVEIVLHNYGLDSIEVTDDGKGIAKEDFESICMKHYTSKIESFEDLNGVETLGFRGEALSSLTAICDLKITTCTKEDYPKASELGFDKMGRLKNKKLKVGGAKGTTVQVSNLFHNLPVRAKNLQKNSKREYSSAINFLTNYLIIYTGIRFSIYNVTKTGKKNLVLGTRGTSNTKIVDNMISIFGSNGGYGLIPLDISVDDIDVKFKMNPMDLPTMKKFSIKFEGYISSFSFGMGRSTTDRQFIYINKRPVQLKRVLKTVNEVYKSFNHVQYPVVIMNIDIAREFLDVNVTPDKRTVIMQNEDMINDILRDELSKFYGHSQMHIPRNKSSSHDKLGSNSAHLEKGEFVPNGNPVAVEKVSIISSNDRNDPITSGSDENERVQSSSSSDLHDIDEDSNGSKNEPSYTVTTYSDSSSCRKPRPDVALSPTSNSYDDSNTVNNNASMQVEPFRIKQRNLLEEDIEIRDSGSVPKKYLNSTESLGTEESENADESDIEKDGQKKHYRYAPQQLKSAGEQDKVQNCDLEISSESEEVSNDDKSRSVNGTEDEDISDSINSQEKENYLDEKEKSDGESQAQVGETSLTPNEIGTTDEKQAAQDTNSACVNDTPHNTESTTSKLKDSFNYRKRSFEELDPHSIIQSKDSNKKYHVHNLSSQYAVDLDAMRRHFMIAKSAVSGSVPEKAKFRLDEITEKEEAEKKLSYIISKEDFSRMKVIGQFNLGFIMVTLNSSNNLFIIDQHASDEKFNFERLKETVQLQSQPLVIPQTMDLNVIDELTVVDNMHVFKNNGFGITFVEDNTPGHRIKLVSLPMSRNAVFDVNDFQELIHLINTDSSVSNKHIKCSKVHSLLAMRACRSSIMVGQHLNRPTMQKVVSNLSSLDKPWNCPHGRPTMRHLIELKNWHPKNLDYKIS